MPKDQITRPDTRTTARPDGFNGPKFHIFLDFDGTILKQNSIPWFEYLQVKFEKLPYSVFFDCYMEDYEEWKKSYTPAKEDRTTLIEEYEYLQDQLQVEEASIKRIEKSEWLKGMEWSANDTAVFDCATEHIPGGLSADSWRAGLEDLCDYILGYDGRVDILSVNWSEQFIRALLRHRKSYDGFEWLPSMNIYCNEIDPHGSGTFSRIVDIFESTRPEDLHRVWLPYCEKHRHVEDHLWTALDKALVMWWKGYKHGMQDAVVVFVGDSKTDLRCLLDADIGIRIVDSNDLDGEQASLQEVLDRLGIRQEPITALSEFYPVLDREKSDVADAELLINLQQTTKIIWRAEDFSEIKKALEKWAGENKDTVFDFREVPAPAYIPHNQTTDKHPLPTIDEKPDDPWS